MTVKKYFKADMPDGFRIFQTDFGVAGTQYCQSEIAKLMKAGAVVTFRLSPDTKNPKDPNAIAIRGVRSSFFGKVDQLIGYVPANLASYIYDSKLLSVLEVRPKRMYLSDSGSTEFTMDIIGPRDQFQQYKSV